MNRWTGVPLVLLLGAGCSYDWSRFDPDPDRPSGDARVDPNGDLTPNDAGVDRRLDDAGLDLDGDMIPNDGGVVPDGGGLPDEPGLILFLPFDEAQGTATREVVSGTNAEVRGPVFIGGVRGSALRFVPDDHVLVTLPSPLDVHMRFTLAVWVRVSAGATGTIASIHGDPHWLLRYSPIPGDEGELSAVARPDYADWPTYRILGPEPVADAWQHVAFTVDGENQVLYVNGVVVATEQVPVPPREGDPSPSCYLGVSGYGHFTDPFSGDLDELRVYDRPLSQAEIETLAQDT